MIMINQVSKTEVMSLFLFYFFIFFLLFLGGEAQNTATYTIKFKVGVVLDLDRLLGKMGLSCMNMALSDFYATHSSYKTRLVLYTRDSNKDVVDAASAAMDLLKNVQVQAMVGPITSSQADFMADLGKKAQVPIISFSASSPAISPGPEAPYFIRTGQNDSSQVKSIASIVKAFGWREVIFIYEETEFGKGIIRYLTEAFQGTDIRVPYRSLISPSASNEKILEELNKLKEMQTRVFIVHMNPLLGSQFFLKAKEVGMMSEGYAWIITDGLANFLGSINSSVINSMQGVLGVRPYVPLSNDLDKFKLRWKRKFIQKFPDMIDSAKMNIYGLWAYDTIWALASAVEKVGITRNSSLLKPKSLEKSTSTMLNFGVSKIGPKLLQEISNIEIDGLSGVFHMVDGRLQSFAFQIVNVIGNGRREIGIWTPENGTLNKGLKVVDTSSNSMSKDNLRSIIWPGVSTNVPTARKRLRIGVPVMDGFNEFVNVTWDDSKNTTTVTGYCIDVFEAVIKLLPYAVPYDLIPFANAHRKSAGTYNELIHQVYLKKYDAVIGDITIIANRSRYVDFTLPYTESGVTMIVPVRDDRRKNAWIFLKPLRWDLWLTTGAFFVYTGFVIWVLEHRINEDFRGPRSHQFGTIFWFTFSTLVFAHKEKVVSNLARFVMIIWVFVVLIITSSYTANLTSVLTVQRLEPTIQDIQELIKSNDQKVGYKQGSFVLGLLERMNLSKSQLEEYKSPEDFSKALSKGSYDGGISAAFDEMPYIKLILAKYGAKYTIVGPTYKTDGFGFAFPIGSSLVPDISRAILEVREGNKMTEIEKSWFGEQKSCPDPTAINFSNSLTLNSFSGLFLIAGISSTLALLIFLTTFIYNHKHIWSSSNPNNSSSIWKRIVVLVQHFDQKDLSSHTFGKVGIQDRGDNVDDIRAYVGASPNVIISTNPPSPNWSNWNRGEESFSPSDDQSVINANVANNSTEEISTIEGTISASVHLSKLSVNRCVRIVSHRRLSCQQLFWSESFNSKDLDSKSADSYFGDPGKGYNSTVAQPGFPSVSEASV